MKKRLLPLLFVLLFATLACSVFTDSSSVEENGNILFQDNFSDNGSGWDRSDWDDGLSDYGNGVYRIHVKTATYDIWANPGKNFDGDVRVEADAIKVSGDDDNNFGLICRYSGEANAANFYFFNISSDGFAIIGKVSAGSQEYLSSDQMQPSEAIKQGTTSNHLRADCVGSTLTLYVNGTQVATATDSAFTSGDVGLMAGTFDVPSTEIHFSNFMVSKP